MRFIADAGLSIEDKLLISRLEDALAAARDRYDEKYIGFLDERALALAVNTVKAEGYCNVMAFGGYPSADRCIFGIFPEYQTAEETSFPIETVTLRYRTRAALDHRDFLGSLMSLGIKRETVGDILVGTGRTVIFLRSDIADYVCSQLEKVGGEGIKITRGLDGPFDFCDRFEQITDTVMSSRADGVVAALCRVSRSAAQQMIRDGAVTADHRLCESVSRAVVGGECISVRGYGKFIIDSLEDKTRKGRIKLCARKYI